jgi:DMSO/TMAO reductase YedYZ molybdopterin-dependent catalytic subunit
MNLTRRAFLGSLAALPAIRGVEALLANQNLAPLSGGRLVRQVPLGRFDRQPMPPFGQLIGQALDARQFTDHSALTADTLITPTDKFFVRTAATAIHEKAGSWTIALGGPEKAQSVPVQELATRARPMGTHVMECSGNVDPANFGLLSAAEWSGVSMVDVLDRTNAAPERPLIRVTGLDEERNSPSSLAGASWIFARADLEKTGAFLATGMNGAPLAAHHGAPVRLVVPNWYGCVCIKWVTGIDFVSANEPPTTQMREFAMRTHQTGIPAAARAFQAPFIEVAATPIRVEQWIVDGRTAYRVIGVSWGGSSVNRPLTIRFKHTESFLPVDDCPAAASATTWSLWSHMWRPSAPGRYQIALGVRDRTIPARRLEMFYYTREVEVGEV